MFGVTDAIGAVHKCQVAHLAEVTGTVLVFQTVRVKSEERILRPEQRSGFCALIPQVQLDAFYLMRTDDSAVLRPSLVVHRGRYTMSGRSGGEDIHDETFVVTMYGEIHLPAIFGTPMPVEHILVALPVEVPVHFPPQLVDAGGKGFFLRTAACIVLVYGKECLHDESGFYEVAAVVFLPERLHPPRIAIPPMGVGAMKAVGGFEEGDNAFHTRQAFLAGDIAPVDACQHRHDAEAAAAGCYYIPVVFGIYSIHVDAFACQPAVGLGAVPEVIESPALYGVQQGFVGQCSGCAAGLLCAAGSYGKQ